MKWKKISRDDYQSSDNRHNIVRLPAWANSYGNRDEWALATDGEPVDVYPTLKEAKAVAEDISTETEQRIARVIRETWYAIREDILTAIRSISQLDAISITTDYIDIYGDDEEAIKVARKLPRKDYIRIAKTVLSDSQYSY